MNQLSLLVSGVAIACASFGVLAAPEISGTVTVEKNQAKNVVAVGGSMEAGKVLGGVAKGAEGKMTGVANVNSVVLNDSNAKISGTVAITGNKADGVYAIGGTANVNSVVMGK